MENLCKWIDNLGVKRAAVTNTPRSKSELLISMLKLEDFFEGVVLAKECARPKLFPNPYLKALKALKVSPNHIFMSEDQMRESCSRVQANPDQRVAVVQFRQHVSHRRTFFYLDLLILKHNDGSRD